MIHCGILVLEKSAKSIPVPFSAIYKSSAELGRRTKAWLYSPPANAFSLGGDTGTR